LAKKNNQSVLIGMPKKIISILRWISVFPVEFIASGLVYVVTEAILYSLKAPQWVSGTLTYIFPPIVGLFTSVAIAPSHKFITAVTITSVLGTINIVALCWEVVVVFVVKSHHLSNNMKIVWAAGQTLIYIIVLIACSLEIGRKEKENLLNQSPSNPI